MHVYTEIIANLAAAGFLGLAFGSGVLYQRVQEVKAGLEAHEHACEKQHENDRDILETLTKLSTQVEIIFSGQNKFHRDTDRHFEEASREKSNS